MKTTQQVLTSLGFAEGGGFGGDYWLKDIGKFGNTREIVLKVNDGTLGIIGKPMSDMAVSITLPHEGELLGTERAEGDEPITAESLEDFCQSIIQRWS